VSAPPRDRIADLANACCNELTLEERYGSLSQETIDAFDEWACATPPRHLDDSV
jgi:hypothetical protein